MAAKRREATKRTAAAATRDVDEARGDAGEVRDVADIVAPAEPRERASIAGKTNGSGAISAGAVCGSNDESARKRPCGPAPRDDGGVLCAWGANAGCWMAADGAEHVVLHNAKRDAQSLL